MDYDNSLDDRDTINEAVNFWNLCNDADGTNRAEALNDIRFGAGEQWPVEIQKSRNLEVRPYLVINKIDAYIRQICNQQRMQTPGIRVHGMNNETSEDRAQIIENIIRHIEVNSNADVAYDTAFEYAVRMGWGYWRLSTRYVREDSYNQEIYIDPIINPFSVYFDPNSVLPDGSDSDRALITTVMRKKDLKAEHPNANVEANFTQTSTGDFTAAWITKEDIRVAEFYKKERKKETLYLLSNGKSTFADEDFKERLKRYKLEIVDERESYRTRVKWRKQTAIEILEEKYIPGIYIPIFPVYGAQLIVGDRPLKYGLIRYAKDPQRMYNFWRTAMTESVALAPKPKWLLVEGQDEGHENEWSTANIKSDPVLRYKQTDIEGKPAPAPQRLQPEPPPAGIMEASAAISSDLQMVLGIMDPNQLPSGNISGKALQGQQNQIDISNYHFYSNFIRTRRHTAKVILNWLPEVYDTERVIRTISADGRPDLTTINQMNEVGEILNDVTVGEYDIVIDPGPGFETKRQQAVEAMMPLLGANEKLFDIAGDLVFRNMDFAGADVIADRLAAANPLAQIDSKSKVPPEIQMKMAQADQTIKAMQQQLQMMQLEIKNRNQVAMIKEEGATKRKLMEVTAEAHNTETMAEVKVNDQNTRAITSQNKSEIDGIVQLLLHHMDTNRLEKEIERRNLEQYGYTEFAKQDVDNNSPRAG